MVHAQSNRLHILVKHVVKCDTIHKNGRLTSCPAHHRTSQEQRIESEPQVKPYLTCNSHPKQAPVGKKLSGRLIAPAFSLTTGCDPPAPPIATASH
jgi:hypothetical protein